MKRIKKMSILVVSILLLVPSLTMASDDKNQSKIEPTTKHEVMQNLYKEYSIIPPSEIPPRMIAEDNYVKTDRVELDRFEKVMRDEIEKTIKINKETDEKIGSSSNSKWIDVPLRVLNSDGETISVSEDILLTESRISTYATQFYSKLKHLSSGHGTLTCIGSVENSLGYWRFIASSVYFEIRPYSYYTLIPTSKNVSFIDNIRTCAINIRYDVYTMGNYINTVNDYLEYYASDW